MTLLAALRRGWWRLIGRRIFARQQRQREAGYKIAAERSYGHLSVWRAQVLGEDEHTARERALAHHHWATYDKLPSTDLFGRNRDDVHRMRREVLDSYPPLDLIDEDGEQ